MMLGALCVVPVAYANTPQPTVENAQKFIVEVLNAKATLLWSDPPGFTPTSKIKDKKITSVSGGGCTTKVAVSYQELEDSNSLRYESKSRTATIVWNDISNVKQDRDYGVLGRRIEIEGSIAWQFRDPTRYIELYADSVEMATRLVNAMNFLREQCDTKKSQYGF